MKDTAMFRFKMNREVMRLIKYFGTIYKLADFLGVHPSSVYRWAQFPEGRAYEIESRLDKKFSAKKLLGK